jgi:uncharacterized protein with PQ loop repeat
MLKTINLGEHRHTIDKLAEINGVVTGIALYPQVFKALTSTIAIQQLSLMTFLLILVNSFVWIIYGIHRGLTALIIASVLNLIASLILVVLSLLAFTIQL